MTADIAADTSVHVTCDRDALAAALGIVSRGIASRGGVQILSGIHLYAGPKRVTVAATDMEISLRASLSSEVTGEGNVVVPGRLLTDLVRLLPDSTVALSYDDAHGALRVSSGNHVSRLQVFAAEDFPHLPPTDVPLHTISADALLATIEKVTRAASRDESRPVLTGVFVRFEGDRLTMAATDSYRLAVKETVLGESGPELEAIIPARALQELARIASGCESVQLGVHENHVIFSAGEVWLTSRRIDGQFPNYRQLLPESFEIELTVPRGPLLDVIRRAGVLAQRNAPLRLRFGDGELRVRAQTQDIGEAEEALAIEYSGDPLEIGFNPDFLREGLESISSDHVQLELINPLRPGLLASPDESFWYLIMPIRLAG